MGLCSSAQSHASSRIQWDSLSSQQTYGGYLLDASVSQFPLATSAPASQDRVSAGAMQSHFVGSSVVLVPLREQSGSSRHFEPFVAARLAGTFAHLQFSLVLTVTV